MISLLLVAFDRFVGVSGVRLGVFGGCRVAGLDFDELRAGLSSSYVAALLFVVSADHSVCYFVIARALCLLQRSLPTPHRVRSVCGCVVGSLGFVCLLGGGQGAGALGCAHARCPRAEQACCVFLRLLRSPATPLRSLSSACDLGKAQEPTCTKNLVLVQVRFIYRFVSMIRTTGKFAAGVATRHTCNGPAPNKRRLESQQTTEVPGAIRLFS